MLQAAHLCVIALLKKTRALRAGVGRGHQSHNPVSLQGRAGKGLRTTVFGGLCFVSSEGSHAGRGKPLVTGGQAPRGSSLVESSRVWGCEAWSR